MGSSTSPTTPIWKKWSITQMLAKPASSAVLPISANFGPIEVGASGQVKRGTCNPMRTAGPSVLSLEMDLLLARLSYPQVGKFYAPLPRYKPKNTKWSKLGFSAVLGSGAAEVRFERTTPQLNSRKFATNSSPIHRHLA